MIFSKKRQSRIWIISLVYKHLVRRSCLFSKLINDTDLSEIPYSVYDELVFAFPKGDIEYFILVYNHLVEHINSYQNRIMHSHRFKANVVASSIAISLCAEQYLGLDINILKTEYQHISRDYMKSSDISYMLEMINLS